MSSCHESTVEAWRWIQGASLLCLLLVRCGASPTPRSAPPSVGRINSSTPGPTPSSSQTAPAESTAAARAGANEASAQTERGQHSPPALQGRPLPSVSDASAPRSPSDPCPDGIVHARLQQVVSECTSGDVRVCGVVKVRASADRKSVLVNFDLSSTTGTDAFTKCVAARVNSIAWQCTLPGSQLSVDLGCKL